MKYIALALVILSTLAFVGCRKKKVEVAKPAVVAEQTDGRVSGPMPVEIVWEEIDGK